MTRCRPLASSLVAALLTGWLVHRLWPRLGLPALGHPGDAPFPGLWRWFFAIWVPALFPVFTALHLRLVRLARDDREAAAANRGLDWDRKSYGGLLLFVLVLLAWRHLGRFVDWRLGLGAVYVGLLFVKTLGLVVTLYRSFVLEGPVIQDDTSDEPGTAGIRTLEEGRGAREAGRSWVDEPQDRLPLTAGAGADDPPGLGSLLFATAFGLYIFLSPYVVTALSTAGDEHIYLLNTQRLFADGDVDISTIVARREYERFYWGRATPELWTGRFLGFPALLLPGYALITVVLPRYPLAGRLGATWTIGLFGAFLSVQAYRLCRELGLSRGAATWGWIVLAFTPPVMTNASHVYPELPAACAVLWGVRALGRLPERPRAAAAVVAAAGFIVGLKLRFAALGLGLLTAAAARLTGSRRRTVLLLIGAVVAAGLGFVLLRPFRALLGGTGRVAGISIPPPGQPRFWAIAGLGLFADQEFGLLFYAPQFVLGAIGLPVLARRRPQACLVLVGLTAFYLIVLVRFRWIQWDAGWTPPPRFVLSVAPLLVPLVAAAIERGRGRLLAALNTLWLVWTSALAAVLAVAPIWRYNGLIGRSTVLQLAGGALGLDLARFLPSLRAPTAWTWVVLALGALALGVPAWRCARSSPVGEPGWGEGAVLLRPGRALGLVLGVAALWLGVAAVVPTWSVEAEAMSHTGGIQFGSYATQPILWVFQRDGELSERIVTWPGQTRITIRAGGLTTIGRAPRMTLLLDGRPIQSWSLSVGPGGRWEEGLYTTRVPTGFGRPIVTLRLADLVDRRRAEPPQLQHAYVDRLEFRWEP